MGRSSGPGSPLSFRCWKCRRRQGRLTEYSGWWWHQRDKGWASRVLLTGKTRPNPPKKHHARGARSSDLQREYVCQDCQHVGWSSHIDLAGEAMVKEGTP